MNAKRCCRQATGWVVPGLGLVLMPKCPACVAGYIAAITGLGVSMTVAAWLRWSMLGLCVAVLAYVAVRTVHRLMSRERSERPANAHCVRG